MSLSYGIGVDLVILGVENILLIEAKATSTIALACTQKTLPSIMENNNRLIFNLGRPCIWWTLRAMHWIFELSTLRDGLFCWNTNRSLVPYEADRITPPISDHTATIFVLVDSEFLW
ncbi:MAG: hypothetical protein OXI60_04195 [Acidiferrobacterales bacterium]|nr:hypothetical protein [Acidiferrobacterales bacterium]